MNNGVTYKETIQGAPEATGRVRLLSVEASQIFLQEAQPDYYAGASDLQKAVLRVYPRSEYLPQGVSPYVTQTHSFQEPIDA